MGRDRADEQAADAPLPLIERKQLAAKRRAQALAFELLRDASFDGVAVEQIAEGSDLSPSTVYRYFGTKEGIFCGDERDDAVIDSFRDRLQRCHRARRCSRPCRASSSIGSLGSMTTASIVSASSPRPRCGWHGAAQHAQLRRTLADVIVESGWRATRRLDVRRGGRRRLCRRHRGMGTSRRHRRPHHAPRPNGRAGRRPRPIVPRVPAPMI